MIKCSDTIKLTTEPLRNPEKPTFVCEIYEDKKTVRGRWTESKLKERTRVTDRLKDWIEYKKDWGVGRLVQRCFASAGVLAAISLATEPSWMSTSPAIERRRCKCEPKDRILNTRSHATGSIFTSTGKVIMLVMVEEIWMMKMMVRRKSGAVSSSLNAS